MNAYVYIDGFNVYYRALRGTPYKWLDVSALASELLDASDTVQAIRYFTADVSPRAGDPTAPERQQTYMRALRTIPNLKVHRGRFLPKTKRRPLVGQEKTFVQVHDTEEKGSDVNLATFLLNDAFRGKFEVALVLSQDTDLIEPLRIVKHDLGLVVGVGWLEGTEPGKKHKRVTDFIRHATKPMLARCQFPNPTPGKVENPLQSRRSGKSPPFSEAHGQPA
ncbi:NYN domain-containing protein [Roseitalea porphyridii]|uniref:NYN domain-containing protein n=1 Tax=Roseitalea porphyridii TaxID=1852022 RepID=UPI001315AA88|nr:NYN domain-containing protein [Roseitalea porphyridii]